jgi:hypothetical protein
MQRHLYRGKEAVDIKKKHCTQPSPRQRVFPCRAFLTDAIYGVTAGTLTAHNQMPLGTTATIHYVVQVFVYRAVEFLQLLRCQRMVTTQAGCIRWRKKAFEAGHVWHLSPKVLLLFNTKI